MWPKDPYKGLNFYSALDAPLFCQRDEEVEVCSQLLGSSATKMLLLHGRTGTGKSSFLRAGLFARYLRNNPAYYVLVDDGEPWFVRSTADPVASITESLLGKLDNPTHFRHVSGAVRAKARESMVSAQGAAPRERAAALRNALEKLTSEIRGTFLLVIDQAEEVFTLESRQTPGVREAYFDFLEQLCFERFDIKIVVTLRTEYYGQFADNFRVAPTLKISPVIAGLDQFMLHGVQSPERLQAAIEWPTSLEATDPELGPPRAHYKFTFAPGLSAEIAKDIGIHCGESSALPVLQIVCSELFDRLPKPPEGQAETAVREIKSTDYSDRDRVPGAIDRYVEKAIKVALGIGDKGDAEATVAGWKHIISSLVARQEGGALTSLLMSKTELKEIGRKGGIFGRIDETLERLSGEKLRLLRLVPVRARDSEENEAYYSLGHDALAPTLLRWKETQGRDIEARDKAKKAATIWIVKLVAAISIIAIVAMFGVLERAQARTMRVAMTQIDAQPSLRASSCVSRRSGKMPPFWFGISMTTRSRYWTTN